MSTADGELTDLLRSLEERLFDAAVRGSPEALANLLAEEFVEFGSSGRVYDRDKSIAAVRVEISPALSLHEFRCMLVTPEVALALYRSSRAAGDGVEEALRSSLWVCRSGQWQIIFHQGTRV